MRAHLAFDRAADVHHVDAKANACQPYSSANACQPRCCRPSVASTLLCSHVLVLARHPSQSPVRSTKRHLPRISNPLAYRASMPRSGLPFPPLSTSTTPHRALLGHVTRGQSAVVSDGCSTAHARVPPMAPSACGLPLSPISTPSATALAIILRSPAQWPRVGGGVGCGVDFLTCSLSAVDVT
jgi:hypothetical protein